MKPFRIRHRKLTCVSSAFDFRDTSTRPHCLSLNAFSGSKVVQVNQRRLLHSIILPNKKLLNTGVNLFNAAAFSKTLLLKSCHQALTTNMSDSDEDFKPFIPPPFQAHSSANQIIDLTSDDEDAPVHIEQENLPPREIVGSPPDQKEGSNLGTQRDGYIGLNDSQVDQGETQKDADREARLRNIRLNQDGSRRVYHFLSNSEPQSVPDTASRNMSPHTKSAMLGLDRATMEAERLSRLQKKKAQDERATPESSKSRKRKRSICDILPEKQDGRQKEKDVISYPHNGLPTCENSLEFPSPKPKEKDDLRTIVPALGNTSEARVGVLKQVLTQGTLSATQGRVFQRGGVHYPDGVVKRTWVRGCPQEEDIITIEDVLQMEDLDLAVLSTFQLDVNWITSKILDTTKVIWVLNAKDEDDKRVLKESAPKNYRFCFPPVGGVVNMMHIKLQLLAHPTHLRVVVPSANLVPYDWGETGVMENICFLIDLPRYPLGKRVDPCGISEFGSQLIHFLMEMGLDQKTVDSISRFDFSRTLHLGFVHSIGGSHSGKLAKRTGYPYLATAVQNLGLQANGAIEIDTVTSSLGAISETFVKTIYLAAQGKLKSETDQECKLSDTFKNSFRIHFPSLDTVVQSKGGVDAAGTIAFQSRWYDAKSFPRDLMRDVKSTRGILMHNKMMFVQSREPHGDRKSWAYVGSHNLSESAWGQMVKDKATKEAKLNCRNWECGVIFPVAENSARSGAQDGLSIDHGDKIHGGDPDLEVFRGSIPIPMVVPSEKYGEKRPWFFKE